MPVYVFVCMCLYVCGCVYVSVCMHLCVCVCLRVCVEQFFTEAISSYFLEIYVAPLKKKLSRVATDLPE